MEASGVIHNWKKMPHSPFPGGFECCTCGCAAGLIAVWFPEPTRVTGSRGRCDPGWQMEHTLPCKGSLKAEGSQCRSAHQSQPHTAHFWLRGFPQGVPERAGGWRLQGAYLMSLPLLQGLTVSFPRERSPPLPTACPTRVGWQHLGVSCRALCCSPRPRKDPWFWPSASAAGGTRVTKKGTANVTGFVSTQRQPASRKRKGAPAGGAEGCRTEQEKYAGHRELGQGKGPISFRVVSVRQTDEC